MRAKMGTIKEFRTNGGAFFYITERQFYTAYIYIYNQSTMQKWDATTVHFFESTFFFIFNLMIV